MKFLFLQLYISTLHHLTHSALGVSVRLSFVTDEGDRLFTVVILRPMGNEAYRVVARSDVSADPGMDSCTVDPHIASVEKCCTTRRLEPVIDITEGNVYAIETAVTASILLNFAETSRPGTVISVPASVSYDVGSTVSSGLLSNVSVEMVRFIAIGKSIIQLHVGWYTL